MMTSSNYDVIHVCDVIKQVTFASCLFLLKAIFYFEQFFYSIGNCDLLIHILYSIFFIFSSKAVLFFYTFHFIYYYYLCYSFSLLFLLENILHEFTKLHIYGKALLNIYAKADFVQYELKNSFFMNIFMSSYAYLNAVFLTLIPRLKAHALVSNLTSLKLRLAMKDSILMAFRLYTQNR